MKMKSIVTLTAALFLGVAAADVFTPIDTLKPCRREALELAKAIQFEGGFARTNDEIVVHGLEKKRAAACWRVKLSQTVPEPIGVSAEAIVKDAVKHDSVLIYVDISYVGGGSLWGLKAFFDPGVNGWQKRTVRILPERPVKAMSIYLMVRNDASAKVRFRSPMVERYRSPGIMTCFDGQVIFTDAPPASPVALLRDVRAETGFVAIRPGGSAFGARLAEKREERLGAQFFTVELSADGGGDKALTFAWLQPLPKGEVLYLPSPRAAALPAGSAEHRNVTETKCGTGGCSRWPFVAAVAGGRGMALGFDPRLPAYGRLALNGALGNIHVAYDVALTAEKPSARMGFVTFAFDAADGFRGALEAYRRLFPEFNKVRVARQGGWMAFKPISKVEGWRDFGFAFKEGDGEPEWDDAHGLITFHYTEPTTWWMRMKERGGGLATMSECLALAEKLASGGNPAKRGYAMAWKKCAIKDVDGNPCGKIRDTPWCNGIVWNLNGAPGQGPDGEFAAKFPKDVLAKRYAGTFPSGVDGEYVDSSELYVTDEQDFNRDNFAGMATPLTFDSLTLRPCVYKGLIAYEYVRGVHDLCRAVGRLVMANGSPGRWWWLAPFIDVMGTETNWNTAKWGWRPLDDAKLSYVRSLCGAKPYCFLQNTDFNAFTPEMCEKFMMKALAYGMYPGFFSPQASSSSHYFSDPKTYNRDRALFKKYMPLCRMVGEAGWRPVNRILPLGPDAGVFAEQFGDRYVTLFNPSTNETRKVAVPHANELTCGIEVEGDLSIPPETCRVLDFKGGEGLSAASTSP